jgi:sporulation protein YlmC with PRC-barrel domain
LVSAEVLRGKKVIGVKGAVIGQVDGVDISIPGWQTTHVRISLSDEVAKELGYRTGMMSRISTRPIMSIPVEAIDQVGDVVTIKDSIKDLKDLEFSKPNAAA